MDLLGSALIIHPHLVWAHIEEGHEKLEWVQFVDLIKVLETRVREDQLEKMKLFSLTKRSREDLGVRSSNFRIVVF